jgi:hypothetical protein
MQQSEDIKWLETFCVVATIGTTQQQVLSR